MARCVLIAAVLASPGCRRGAQRVEPEKARDALRTALDAWQQQRSVNDLRALRPEIVAQDPDWEEGRKLVSYEVVEETDDNLNLRMKVRLVVAGEGGETKEKTVSYVVGTSPVLTVFREPL